MAVDCGYFDKFNDLTEKYVSPYGQGETMATQICTAVTNIIYHWYNDGDVFDNTYHLKGWWNDISSYANWLSKYADGDIVLDNIETCDSEDDYEDLLKELADGWMDSNYLNEMNEMPIQGDIYECNGKFKFKEPKGEDEEDEWW